MVASAEKGKLMRINLTMSNGRFLDSVSIGPNETVSKLKELILHSNAAIRPIRQRLTLPPFNSNGKKHHTIVLEDKKTLSHYGLKEGSNIVVKDMGPQISWRGVFILEYLGPLLVHQIFFFYRLNTESKLDITQILAYACVTFHFLKREYESLFVHRFSNSTMPLRNLFQNSFHYWVLAGLMIAFFLYSPGFESRNLTLVILSLCVFLAAELGNFYSHIVLRDLRPAGSNTRGIPRGFGFNLVSCPNYTFEVLAWASLSTMTGLWSMWIFTLISGAIMCSWALKKHRRYRREFPDYPKSRKAIIPLIC